MTIIRDTKSNLLVDTRDFQPSASPPRMPYLLFNDYYDPTRVCDHLAALLLNDGTTRIVSRLLMTPIKNPRQLTQPRKIETIAHLVDSYSGQLNPEDIEDYFQDYSHIAIAILSFDMPALSKHLRELDKNFRYISHQYADKERKPTLLMPTQFARLFNQRVPTHSLAGTHTQDLLRTIVVKTPLSGRGVNLISEYLPKSFDVVTRGIRDVVTRGIPVLHRTQMNEILSNLPHLDATLPQIVHYIKLKFYTHPIFDGEPGGLYILEALRQDLISIYDFYLISLFRMAVKQWNEYPTPVNFFDKDGNVDPVSRSIITSTFPAFCNNAPFFEAFINELKKFPESEHQYFLIPDTGSINTVEKEIRDKIINHFGQVQLVTSEGLKNFLIIAPLGMYQAFYNAQFGPNAVELLPAIGPMRLSELRNNALQDTRVVSVYNEILDRLNIQFPEEADGHSAKLIHFVHHDIRFHGHIASAIPPHIRRRFVAYERCIHTLATPFNETTPKGKFFRKVGYFCIDLEHTFFRHENLKAYPSPEHIFWAQLARHISRLKPLFLKRRSNEVNLSNDFRSILTVLVPTHDVEAFHASIRELATCLWTIITPEERLALNETIIHMEETDVLFKDELLPILKTIQAGLWAPSVLLLNEFYFNRMKLQSVPLEHNLNREIIQQEENIIPLIQNRQIENVLIQNLFQTYLKEILFTFDQEEAKTDFFVEQKISLFSLTNY